MAELHTVHNMIQVTESAAAGHGTDKGNCVSRASPRHGTIAQHLQVSHPDTATLPPITQHQNGAESVSVQTTTGKLSVSKLTKTMSFPSLSEAKLFPSR